MTHTDIDTVAAASAVAERDAHRARYDALRAAGQGETARALPPPTDRGLALDPAAVRHRETIPGGWYWTTRLVRGEALRLVNVAGSSTVSLVAWSVADTSERLNLADTTKVQWSVALRKGRILFTDMGRVALSIVEDTSGRHDALVGATTRESTGTLRNSTENFLAAAAKLGLSRRDIPPCVNFFAPVEVDGEGRFAWHGDLRRAGDFVDLRPRELDHCDTAGGEDWSHVGGANQNGRTKHLGLRHGRRVVGEVHFLVIAQANCFVATTDFTGSFVDLNFMEVGTRIVLHVRGSISRETCPGAGDHDLRTGALREGRGRKVHGARRDLHRYLGLLVGIDRVVFDYDQRILLDGVIGAIGEDDFRHSLGAGLNYVALFKRETVVGILPGIVSGFFYANGSVNCCEVCLLRADSSVFLGVFTDTEPGKTLGCIVAKGFQSTLNSLWSDEVRDERNEHRDYQDYQQDAAIGNRRPRDLQAFPASASALCHD